MSHIDPHNAKNVLSKGVKNENLDFLRWSAVFLLSAVCLLFTKASNTKTAQGKDVLIENLEFLRWSAVC